MQLCPLGGSAYGDGIDRDGDLCCFPYRIEPPLLRRISTFVIGLSALMLYQQLDS